MDKRLLESIKVQLFVILLITISFICMWFFINSFEDVQIYIVYLFKTVFSVFYLIAVGILFRRIFKIWRARKVKPIKCIVRDFIKVVHVDKMDSVFLILEGYDDYKLYFTYRDHEFPLFTFSGGVKRIRKDGSEVKIGDIVYIYIVKNLEEKIEFDCDKNVIYLDKIKYSFNHENDDYDIQIMKDLNCFEGIIDIEIRPE